MVFKQEAATCIDLYRHQEDFDSPNNIYDETRTGARVSLTRALWSDFLTGSVSYTLEDVGISLNGGWNRAQVNPQQGVIGGGTIPPNVPDDILSQTGDHIFQRFGTSLAYDTRNSVELPDHGQRTEVSSEFSAGPTSFYKLEAKNDWFFPVF